MDGRLPSPGALAKPVRALAASRGQRQAARLAPAAWLLLVALSVAVSGCSDAKSRIETHVQRADEALAQGRLQDGLIELHSALKLDRTSATIPLRIAGLLVLTGDLVSARFYYGEAYRLDPERPDAAIRLADLERGTDPAEAKALVEEVLARSPASAWGPIGLAEQALFDEDTEAALAAAQRATELQPELGQAYWHLARVHMARIREFSLAGEEAPNALFEDALTALDRVAELEPHQRWWASEYRARVNAAWPDHGDEAEDAVREAIADASTMGVPSRERAMLELAIEIGRNGRRYGLLEWAIERKLEINPMLFQSWEDLAAVYRATKRDEMVIYRRMLKTVPNSAEAQARYAGMLYRMHGLPRAERHLLSALRVGKVPGAPLLATTARLQYIAGQREKALETVIELEGRFPDSPDATVMAAWRWLETGHAVRAIQVLQEHAWVEESASAQRVLIDAYTRLGQPTRTRTALETAMALLPEPDLLMRRQYARALYDTGDFRRSLRLFQQLSRSVRLRSDERVRIAGALYETGAHGIGRRILTDLVDERPPSALAVAELATREGHSAAQAERVRSALEALLEKNIRNRRALRTLAGFEIANGTPERAIEPLERAIAFLAQHERRTGIVDLILARVQLASGDIEAARATALRALDTEPTLAEALPLAASLYRNAEEARAAIQEMRKDIDDKDQPAQRHALLGRLYIKAGQVVMARWSYEQALTKGLRLPILHNDLAYLLAKRGRDLQRARLLAQQAFEAMPGVPGAADTLGFVLLKLGAIDEAVREFRRALELARLGEGPTAEIQYHLGLALAELGRSVDAEKAFETALALDADFGDADDARRQLARVRGES